MFFEVSSERVICFDVDSTLIMWDDNYLQPFEGCITMQCPHDGQLTYHRPHARHIEFLRKQQAKGMTVIVWSASGTKWASEAVKVLGLENYVDIVMSKPEKCVDDLPNASDILTNILYLDIEGFSI